MIIKVHRGENAGEEGVARGPGCACQCSFEEPMKTNSNFAATRASGPSPHPCNCSTANNDPTQSANTSSSGRSHGS